MAPLPGELGGAWARPLDILVNNAGFTTMGAVRMADRADELALVRTNVEAVVDLCTLFVPSMATRHRGAVMNTASTASFQPLPGQASYGASKAFVLSYGRALAAELRGSGVTVTTLCPGPVETGFAEAAGMTDEEAAESLPKIMWLPADEVARAGVEGLAAGRTVVIPGTANRVGAGLAHLARKSILVPLLAKRHPALKDGLTKPEAWERPDSATPVAGPGRTPPGRSPKLPLTSTQRHGLHRRTVARLRGQTRSTETETNGVRMPQLVSELDLPTLDTVGLERREAIDAIAAARSVHWLARSELGYSVTRQQDVTAILRDQRFHSALSIIERSPEMQGSTRPGPAQRVHPHHGGPGPRPSSPVGGPGLHASFGQPTPAHHAAGGGRTGRPRRRCWRV